MPKGIRSVTSAWLLPLDVPTTSYFFQTETAAEFAAAI